MNDLDLRTALHRDADLVGLPSPDLLDQLVQRRRHQQRQRAGMLAAGLAVAVIAVGIPVGQSLLSRSDSNPAGETTVASTPSVTPEVAVTPPVTPDVVPTPTAASTSAEAPASSVPPPADVTPPCPDLATLDAALPADTASKEYAIFETEVPICSGDWAAAGYRENSSVDGEWRGDGQAGIFRYVDGSWTWLDRYTTDVCDDAGIPADVWYRACNVD
jgi:hypothetical protein